MDDEYHIRAATNADGSAVRELVFRVLRDYGLAPDPGGTDRDLDDIEAHYSGGGTGGSFDVMVNAAGQIVGSVGVYRLDDRRCEIRKMYLDPAYRGRGLGRRLLEHALEQARRGGFQRVELETASVLKEAITLYVAYGFERFTPEHMAARCDQAYFLELR